MVTRPHLIGKHPQHEYGLSSSPWQLQTQQQHMLSAIGGSSSAASSAAGYFSSTKGYSSSAAGWFSASALAAAASYSLIVMYVLNYKIYNVNIIFSFKKFKSIQ